MVCSHENATFVGQFSLAGNYVCPDCQAVIDAVEFAKLRGHLHFMLIDYYTSHPDRLDPMWRDHPWVEHLYVSVGSETLPVFREGF